MRHVPTLVRRELAAYFLGPTAWLVLLGFQVVAAVDFWQLVEILARPQSEYSGVRDPMNTYIGGSPLFWIALMVAVPALTMRLLAEERRSGTIEPLLTAPVTEGEVVVAKWLGGWVMYEALLLPFLVYLPILRRYGEYPFDLGPLLSLLIGLSTAGMMFVALGLLFSALTRQQLVAAVGTFAAMFVLVGLSWAAYVYGAERGAAWAEGVKFVAVLPQILAMGAGQLDPRWPLLHLSATAVLLFAATKVLQLGRGDA